MLARTPVASELFQGDDQVVRQATAELQAANQQLPRTNAALNNVIYAASHNLKTLITNIGSLLAARQEQLSFQCRTRS